MLLSFSEPLLKSTPLYWAHFVSKRLDLLLSDHAYCERKAAAFAIGLLQRYGHFYDNHLSLSKLVREEMRHYELVLNILKSRNLGLVRLPASGYARNLQKAVVTDEPLRHIRLLLVAAVIEARSCERFEVLAKYLSGIDDNLAVFYNKLALAEKRHHMLYIRMACKLTSEKDVIKNLQEVSELEQTWLDQSSIGINMHSGLLLEAN